VFSNAADGYSYPQSDSVSAGETVYVRVAGQFINTGTYAIRYYEPFTVTFDTDGGTSVSSQTVVPGGTVTEPAAPTKTDHLFAGWYKEVALTTLWDFATDTVPGNATLYARWIPFKMVPVPVPGGGIAFPTGTDDSGTATVADAYELGETEVTYELWHTVRSWAESNGYSFFNNPGREGSSATSQNTTPGVNRQEPVTMATWFDAVVWLNALTEWVNAKTGSGLTPVYYYDSGYATVAKNSDYSSNFEKANSSYSYASAYVKPGATGFRLPTSEEWELAARWRGTDTTNTVNNGTFNAAPWFTQGDSASGATADYNDATETNKVAWYYDSTDFPGGTKKTQAVKGKAANTLGLYDMSGNVWEWCFDWYPSYSGSRRIMRGGGWGSGAFYLQVGYVIYDNPGDRGGGGGFRPARTAQ
jgi:uncharacterized repeat protein (TIGR02543 family)